MTSPQGMDDLFWGRDYEDVSDRAERLTMAAEVRDLTLDKLFKIAKLNLRGRAKEWFRMLQPAPVDWVELRMQMIQKYGNIDADDIRMKMDAIKQEPRERVQKYFERLDKLFRKGQIHDVEQRRRFLARLKPEIRKLCVIRVFADIEELVGATIEVERVLGELGKTPFEPLKEEQEEGVAETSMEHHVANLNNTLINFFKGGLGHSEDRCWKKSKDGKSHSGAANFLEVLLNDEVATLQQLNELCGNENVFSYTRIPRRRLPIELPPMGVVPPIEATEDNVAMNRENSIRSKILSHFIKGKISLTPMETVMMIPSELEQLENLVKVARKKKDAKVESTQMLMVSAAPTLRRICVNKTHRSKTLHLSVEMNDCLIEGLVDTGASMSVMAAAVVREMGMMHLVSRLETYKTASGMVTQAMGRIDEVSVKAGRVLCTMTFMVVDTDNYDVLLGLDFLIKIGAIVDVERGLIQVRHGPGSDVEVLPLTMVNMLQALNSEALMQSDSCIAEKFDRMMGNPCVGDNVETQQLDE
ncbi:unnamed protein product [Sphagnum jensenii]|uniref:Retrotransposon gag domain-containing protein n=1 Tax=Sphagnum jensenii TaxID=128206 RepID=A0ABP1B2N9_9BRYO